MPLAGLAILVLPHPPLTRDAGFVVRQPVDGSEVGDRARVSWTAVRGATRYALVVDAAAPAPGRVATAGERVLLVAGQEAWLTLGPASKGSPSSRRFHTVSVVPLDSDGRRIGEDVATVHLRGRSRPDVVRSA